VPQADGVLFAGHDLACRRGGRPVFEALSFALAAGDALVLRGRNGSGKSSLLRLLAGFLRPSAGRLSWAGEDALAAPVEHRCRIHHVGHTDAVKAVLTVRENLAAAAAIAGGDAAIGPALAGMGLDQLADSPARFLSAGQRRRLALARLLATPRPLWLLDEPGTGLDRASRARLEAAIGRHRAGGGIAVIATHGDVAVERPLLLDFDA
jgi:heme exporter protein A